VPDFGDGVVGAHPHLPELPLDGDRLREFRPRRLGDVGVALALGGEFPLALGE
jgi:hypothetical protein